MGRFLEDSSRVGQPVRYAFSFRHSPETEVFFPDSTYQFGAFEFKSREIFITKTDKRGSLDSVVYVLVPYTAQQQASLQLPVYVITEGDCTLVHSQPDTLYLRTFLTDSLAKNAEVRSDYQLVAAEVTIDYWKYIRQALAALFIMGLLYALFAKSIERWYSSFRFKRRHKEFTNKFKKWMREANNREVLSEALIAWKKHLQWLENKPFTSFTTQEIIENIANERLRDALREIDMAIFGGVESKHLSLAMNRLLEVADAIFVERHRAYKEALRQTKRKPLLRPDR